MKTEKAQEVIVVGAGAAGCFGAIRAAASGLPVSILEAGREPLRKVRISGGGRCNLTHACFDPALLVRNYPRGHKELRGAFHRFQPRDTLEWFAKRGVETKTEADGRIFPVSDSSGTVIDCLLAEMERLRVRVHYGHSLVDIRYHPRGQLELTLANGATLQPRACLLATGSLAADKGLRRALENLGHTLVPTVPSLFTFRIASADLRELAGVAVKQATVTLPDNGISQSGALLITHTGLSGPAVLKLSAWAAPELHAVDYHFPIKIQWLPDSPAELRQILQSLHRRHPKKRVDNSGPATLPKRLWQRLTQLAGADAFSWSQLPAEQRERLVAILGGHHLAVAGKNTHKEEFVTCGGVALKNVDFRTLASRTCPPLYFAGETLDIDGVTGGFNFQAAWTTGHIAGTSIAATLTAGLPTG